MLTKRIIPCLDVDAGRVVKGTNFVEIKDAGDPVELAQKYNREGADELVFLDITASSDNREIILDVVAKTAEQVFIPLTVGGGIRDTNKMRQILKAGADKVAVNTSAVQNPELIQAGAALFGDQCIVVAIDHKGPEVYIHGGRTPTGKNVVEWAKQAEALGAGEILLTSMDRDGTQSGYDIETLQAVSSQIKIPVIASGGAGQLEHIDQALQVSDAALLASLLHYGQMTIPQIKEYLLNKNRPIRKI